MGVHDVKCDNAEPPMPENEDDIFYDVVQELEGLEYITALPYRNKQIHT